MTARRTTGVAAAFLAGALALGACSSPTPAGDTALPDEASNITVAWNQAFYSYNNQSSTGNAVANGNIIYLASSSFNYYDNNAELIRNEEFGTYEQVSEDPLIVEYTINEGVTWSDGTPIDAADLLLYWASNSGALNTPDYEPETDADGNILPGTGAEVYFDGSIGSGLENVSQVPEIGEDGRSITMTYDNIFVDWELAFWSGGDPGMPAHVVAEKALDVAEPQAAKDALVTAIQNNDAAALKSLADFWNTGFNFTSLPDDPDLYLSSGAYVIDTFEADQFITLVRNEAYTWGPEPSIDQVTVRFITDPNAAVTALQNGEVDVISPQPTSDVRTALDQLENITVESSVDATYEHIDLQFQNSRNPEVFADPRVREAFLKTVPRQGIVDTLIEPLNPEATIRNSFILSEAFPGYDEVVEANGMSAYDTVDIPGAQALLAEAGVTAPEVCLLYASDNPRRVSEFQLIQASAAEAGFNVTDCGSPDWSTILGSAGAYDASLFGWQSTSTGVTEAKANFITTGINNFSFYSNPAVDALFAQLDVTTEEAAQIELQKQIETLLVQDSFGLTLYQFPGVTAFRDTVTGISTAPLSPTIFWNFWEWQLA